MGNICSSFMNSRLLKLGFIINFVHFINWFYLQWNIGRNHSCFSRIRGVRIYLVIVWLSRVIKGNHEGVKLFQYTWRSGSHTGKMLWWPTAQLLLQNGLGLGMLLNNGNLAEIIKYVTYCCKESDAWHDWKPK